MGDNKTSFNPMMGDNFDPSKDIEELNALDLGETIRQHLSPYVSSMLIAQLNKDGDFILDDKEENAIKDAVEAVEKVPKGL